MKQTRQPVWAVKQSIYLDVYDTHRETLAEVKYWCDLTIFIFLLKYYLPFIQNTLAFGFQLMLNYVKFSGAWEAFAVHVLMFLYVYSTFSIA
jgi:hypothetical protein